MAALASSQPARADSLLIWSPVKVAPRTYQTTVGFRLPMAWEASAGADLGIGAATDGQVASGSKLAAVWGKLADDRSNPGGSAERAVGVRLDMLTGSGALSLSHSRDWIASENLDMSASRALSVNYAAGNSAQTSINATQALTFIYPWAGTSLSASGTVSDQRDAINGTLALNQPVAANLDFTASFTGTLASEQTGDVRLNYNIKW